jgi:hypothetical protein
MALVFAASLALYAISVSPVVFWGDSAEFATRAATLDLTPVARGYPLHRVLSWGVGRIVGSPALGANLVSAVFGAAATALTHELGRRISGSRAGGFASAAALGLCPTFWLYSGVAEVYTLHVAFVAAMLLAAHASDGGRTPRLVFGALVGLSFLHHRMTAFALPGLCVLAALRARRAGALRKGTGEALAGFAIGVVPFVLLCLLASRSPPDGTPDPAAWWFRDVFVGGDQNTAHVFGSGVKSFGANLAYVARWLAYDLPGPALLLCAAGVASLATSRRDETWAWALLLPLHLVFPLRYDWTGDQFSFLVPFVGVAAPLAAVGVAEIERRRPRLATASVAATAATPLAVALVLAFTPAGKRLLPGLTEEARRALVLPVHVGDTTPRDFAARNLARVPPRSLLHADWGDGQVYLYLQRVEGLRTDVDVRIWYGRRPKLVRDGREEWLSAMPGTLEPPAPVRLVSEALDDVGGGLHRVRAAESPR